MGVFYRVLMWAARVEDEEQARREAAYAQSQTYFARQQGGHGGGDADR